MKTETLHKLLAMFIFFWGLDIAMLMGYFK